MVDEKLDDQVWVTVVATGYGQARQRRRELERPGIAGRAETESRSALREPQGEPRVRRATPRSPSSPLELDVPEFIPRR
jgi:cell division protein FtsZ